MKDEKKLKSDEVNVKEIGRFLNAMKVEVGTIYEMNNLPKRKENFSPILCGMNSRPK